MKFYCFTFSTTPLSFNPQHSNYNQLQLYQTLQRMHSRHRLDISLQFQSLIANRQFTLFPVKLLHFTKFKHEQCAETQLWKKSTLSVAATPHLISEY